jgi:hypothetical protein
MQIWWHSVSSCPDRPAAAHLGAVMRPGPDGVAGAALCLGDDREIHQPRERMRDQVEIPLLQ